MNRKLEFSIGEFYHLYSRGNDKRIIFTDSEDKERFLRLLFLCNSSKSLVLRDIPIGDTYVFNRDKILVDIGAYCLMSNHFHLLVREREDDGISLFMQKLLTAYSMYFNKKHSRSGKLFEGAFGAVFADKDEQLNYLYSYIHLNPVKLIEPDWKEQGIKDIERARTHLAAYKYSSYPDHLGVARKESAILNREAFPEYFASSRDLDAHINDWLNYQNNK